MTRVLISTAGSAGDLFPRVPVVQRLQADDHQVLFAVPRSLGLYMRSIGQRAYAIGDEIAAFAAGGTVNRRFFGWGSLPQAYVTQFKDELRKHTAQFRKLFRTWHPDVVVPLKKGAPSRIAGHAEEIPHLQCSSFPNWFRLNSTSTNSFALTFQREVLSFVPPSVISAHGFEHVAWGLDPRTVVLHDPVLLDPDTVPATATVVGFPYWDELPVGTAELERATAWAEGQIRPIVAVILGLFIGALPNDIWGHVADAAKDCGVRVLAINASRKYVVENSATLAVGSYPCIRFCRLCPWLSTTEGSVPPLPLFVPGGRQL